jgi:hypothetical protein
MADLTALGSGCVGDYSLLTHWQHGLVGDVRPAKLCFLSAVSAGDSPLL